MRDKLKQSQLGRHGGPRTKGVRNPDPILKGVRRNYVIARLERDGYHGLAAAVRARNISAHAIAIALGWVARPARIGNGSDNAQKRRELQIQNLVREGLFDDPHVAGDNHQSSPGPDQMMELVIGPGSNLGSSFRDRATLQRAWVKARDELLARTRPGRRPMGWWEFEAPGLGLKHPGYTAERSYLWRIGALGEHEKSVLEAAWKVEFDRCSARDFMIARPWPEDPLTGDAAKRAHLAFCDCPPELAEKWCAELGVGEEKAPPG